MKRILQVVRRMNYGGLETLIMNLYRNMDRTEFQFDFIVDKEGEYDAEIKKMGGKIFYIPYITDIGEKKLRDFFRNHREYKIVHSHLDQVSGIIMKAAYLEQVPIRISHSHNTSNSNNFLGKIYKAYLQSMIGKYANTLFACSENAAKWLFKKRHKEAYIVNNGIEIQKFKFSDENRQEIRKSLDIKDDEEIWGHIGRFSKQKNHTFLIDIFYEYQKIYPNTKLLLIGAGELKTKIEKKVKQLGINKKVKFIGTVENPEKYYSAFDLMIFPSLYEGLSLVMVEAQVAGVPIFASSNIDHVTDITNTLHYLSLGITAREWAMHIIENKDKRNVRNINKVKQKGFDIKDVAKELSYKYSNLLEGNK